MGHTFSNILIHAIFSTKIRQPLITPEFKPRLHEFLGGIARKEFGTALRIGGTEDHVHALLSLRPNVSIADAMCKFKSLSSGWLHRTVSGTEDFAWQEGYGAFSVSPSKAAEVIRYIENQAEHHRRRSFQEEYVEFLERHGVEFDPENVWD